MIASGKAKPMPLSISREFAEFLESLPLGSSIDWTKMLAHSSIEWYEKSDQELVAWARTLRIGAYGYVALWYNANKPCLLTGFEFGVANLDMLTWGAPGPRYLFGVEIQEGAYRGGFAALIETTGGRLLRGVIWDEMACRRLLNIAQQNLTEEFPAPVRIVQA